MLVRANSDGSDRLNAEERLGGCAAWLSRWSLGREDGGSGRYSTSHFQRPVVLFVKRVVERALEVCLRTKV